MEIHIFPLTKFSSRSRDTSWEKGNTNWILEKKMFDHENDYILEQIVQKSSGISIVRGI